MRELQRDLRRSLHNPGWLEAASVGRGGPEAWGRGKAEADLKTAGPLGELSDPRTGTSAEGRGLTGGRCLTTSSDLSGADL